MSRRLTGSQEKVRLRLTWRLSHSALLAGDTCSASQPAAWAHCTSTFRDKAAHEEEAGEAGRKAARR